MEVFSDKLNESVWFQGSELRPLQCDKWIASSSLQKAIRRGDVVTAQRAGLTLLSWEATTAAVWRRLLVIAFEDIGIGAPQVLAEVAALTSSASVRSASGSNESAFLSAIQLLSMAAKDRSTDLLIASAMHDKELEGVRQQCTILPVAERLALVADGTRSLHERAVAAWYASGVESWPERRVGRGDLSGLMHVFREAGCPDYLLEAVLIGVRRTREPIVLFTPLLWSEVARGGSVLESQAICGELVDGVPLYALDGHTRVGRQSLAKFRQENSEIAKFVDKYIGDAHADKALHLALFYVDSAPVCPRFNWAKSALIERLGIAADFQSIPLEEEVSVELMSLVRRNLSHLNDIRSELLVAVVKALRIEQESSNSR